MYIFDIQFLSMQYYLKIYLQYMRFLQITLMLFQTYCIIYEFILFSKMQFHPFFSQIFK